MSDIGEAIGTAAEGGLFAKAVGDTKAPVRDASGHFEENSCLNCGTPLVGSHCHECGQKAHLHRTIGAFLHDLLHGALHFEGKTWRTLPELALRPGKLTRRYIEGERARFVSPMALFLFSVFLMFAIFQAAGLSTPTDFNGMGRNASEKAQEAQIALENELETVGEDAKRRAELEGELELLKKARAAIDQGDDYAFTGPDGERYYQNVTLTGIEFIDQGIVKKWRTNPSLMLYKLQANAYKFSWLLIPLSIPFVWLLFVWKRRFKAYDHAIFVTYSIAFMSMLFITASVMGMLGVSLGLLIPAALLIPPIHLYKHLRHGYALSRFSTIWRLCVLLLFIFVVVLLFLNLLLIIGAF